jgi:hypothetical protein
MMTCTFILTLADRQRFLDDLLYTLKKERFEEPSVEELADSTLIVTQKFHLAVSSKMLHTLLLKKEENHLTLITCGGQKIFLDQWLYTKQQEKMVKVIEEVMEKNRDTIERT